MNYSSTKFPPRRGGGGGGGGLVVEGGRRYSSVLRRRRERWPHGSTGNRQPDPHPRRAVAWHRAEDQKGASLRCDKPDIVTPPRREALLDLTRRGVLERR